KRHASEAQAIRFAERVLTDIEEARSIILRPSERENQGETPQEQQKVEGEATREQVRKPRQEQRELRDNEAISEEQRERPENGFIDEKNPQQREAGELTPRELKRFQESGRSNQRR
ncbi:MAG: hypothetical protein HY564_01970, partial [Candidatus Jacksonbacteria bacterium]|nr:hypothetical protein [Candidatus Jacksonbacteria bacterium]